MAWYKADLHLHSVLSPCATLEMSPANIVSEAVKQGLQIIGLTDHNSTRNALLCRDIAAKQGMFCLCGAEINTKEEVHCLLFAETAEQLSQIEEFLDSRLPAVQNHPDIFGYQLVLDENENIIDQPEKLLINAVDATLDEISSLCQRINGILILAHIDKSKNSVLSQLGFIPPDLNYTALEVSRNSSPEKIIAKHSSLADKTFVTSSDAHQPNLIGSSTFMIDCDILSFQSVREALINNRVKL